MPMITLLRGFKVPVAVLDAFLEANNLDATYGSPPLPNRDQAISALLRDKAGAEAGDPRVFIPSREAYNHAALAYVAFTWLHVFAQREVKLEDELLPEIPPPGFLRLKEEILGFSGAMNARNNGDDDSIGAIGFYIVYTYNRGWTPQVLYDRIKAPVHCDRDATFEDFTGRQIHRKNVHGSSEGTNPLPEA